MPFSKQPDKRWADPDREGAGDIGASVTHVRILSSAALTTVFAEFPDVEAKISKAVKQKKRFADEAERKKHIRDKFFPNDQDIKDKFDAMIPRTRDPQTLSPQEVVEILKPYRKQLISDTLSDEDFAAFVTKTFDRSNDGAIDLEELKSGIHRMKKEAGKQLLEVQVDGEHVRRKSGVMTAHERRSMTTDAKVEALDAKFIKLDAKVSQIDKKIDAKVATLDEKMGAMKNDLAEVLNVLKDLNGRLIGQ